MKRVAQAGFTLIEMLVIAPIVILAIGAFITVIVSMTGEVLSSRGSNALAYNIQDAINRIEQDVKLSTTFLATNNVPLVSGGQQGYNNDASTNFTNVGGASGTSLILNMLVTNGNPISASSGLVYLSNKPNSCASTNVSDNVPMTMNVVYFVKPDTNNVSSLWRRTIMPSNYTTAGCSTPYQQPSCAPGYTHSFCKTNDVKLVEGVEPGNFFVQYFTSASSQTADATASNAGATTDARNTALEGTTTVGVAISASQSVAGRTIERSATLRASRLETNASTIADTPVQSALSTPAGVTASGTSSSQIKVTWYAPAGTPTSYTLQYSRRSDFSNPTTISGITTTNRTVSSLDSATSYFFRVSATNSLGTTSYSSGVIGSTDGTNDWGAYTKFTGVGDWNKDGKNDVIGYKSNGDIELHLGNGNATFGGIISLGNIGTSVRNFIGPGILPSGDAPVLFWVNTDASAYTLKSDGAYGVTGSPILSANSSTPSWGSAGTSVFAVPNFYYDGTTGIVVKSNALYMWRLNADASVTYLSTFGSGWDSSFPGDRVFGAGRFSADSVGDIIGITSAGAMNLYNGLGSGTTAGGVNISSGWTSDYVTGGWDYTGEGYPDILRYYTPYAALCIYTGNGNAGFAAGGSCTIQIN